MGLHMVYTEVYQKWRVGRSRHGPTSTGLHMAYTDVYQVSAWVYTWSTLMYTRSGGSAGLGMDLYPWVYTCATLMYTRSRHVPTSVGLHMAYTDVYQV